MKGMPGKIANEAISATMSFLPLLVGVVPNSEMIAELKMIAIVLSIICSVMGISWWVIKFYEKYKK